MPDYDETGGWVFSDEFHRWQDDRNQVRYGVHRNGSELELTEIGWSAGMFKLKPTTPKVGSNDFEDACASWPIPVLLEDLNGLYHSSYLQFPGGSE